MTEPSDVQTEVDEGMRALGRMHRAELTRLNRIQFALRSTAPDIYVPSRATAEYQHLVRQSRFNVLPLTVAVVAENLYLDGYRSPRDEPGDPAQREKAPENVFSQVWQPNRMDARQAGIYRTALGYGYSYVSALPGADGVPVLTPHSPRLLTADYDELDDEWPVRAVIWDRHCVPLAIGDDGKLWVESPKLDGSRATYLTDKYVVRLRCRSGGGLDTAVWDVLSVDEHGWGVCPVVRYLDSQGELETLPPGKIEPMISVQAQLDQTTFNLLMAQQYSAFRQRWVTGMEIQEDERGAAKAPFNTAVDQILHAESADTKFGEFGQTDLTGYLQSRDKAMLFVATMAQLPPHAIVISGGMSNISAEALASLENSHRRDVEEHKSSFGEGHEQLMRLCSKIMGDEDGWTDYDAQAAWRDTTPRSIGEVADALGKLATMLSIPAKALWEKVPGVTETDLVRWEAMAAEAESQATLMQLLAPPAPTAPVAAPGQTGQPGQLPNAEPAAPVVAPA